MSTPPGAPPAAQRFAARLRARWWLLPIALAFFYVVPYYPKIHSANELPRAYLVKALVDHGSLAIDDGVARWGATADVSPWRGRSYSNKAPGSSILTAPAYAVTSWLLGHEPSLGLTVWLGRVVTGIVPTLLLLWILYGHLARYGLGDSARRLVLTVYALGSMAMPYSLLFISHQPSAVAVVLAWIGAQQVLDGQGGVKRMAAAGLAAGFAPLLDYQAAFALPPLALLLGVRLWRHERRDQRWRWALAAVAGALLPVVVLLGYHQLAFDSPWRTGYDASETFAIYHRQGFLGITELRWRAFLGSMVTADNGLLVFAPYWALALPGLRRLWRAGHRGDAAMMAATAIGLLLFLSSITFWRGGWQLGPRYVTVMLPMLLAPVAVEMQAWSRHWLGAILVAAACLVGVAVYAGSCAQFPHFPERFPNPFFEITVRLWTDGHAAPNPLALLGVGGPWSLVPYVLAVAVAVALALRAQLGSWRVVLGGAAVAVVALGCLRAVPHGQARNEDAYQWIRGSMTQSVW